MILACALLFVGCSKRKLDAGSCRKEFESSSGMVAPKSAVWTAGSRGSSDFHGDYTFSCSFGFERDDLDSVLRLDLAKWKEWKVINENYDISPNGGEKLVIPSGSYFSEREGPGDCMHIFAVKKDTMTAFYWRATW